MIPEKYSIDDLHNYLNINKIASLNDLKRVLGTDIDKTVFRKLKKISYRSSYSHRGKYYTTVEVANFDNFGLWAYNNICFSKHGTLINTAKSFIENSKAGYSVRELDNILYVKTKESLLNMYKRGIIDREKMSGVYCYFSVSSTVRKRQRQFRESQQKELPSIIMVKQHGSSSDKVKAAIILFFSILNEKERRLYAGLEALKLGHSGDKIMSELLGIDVHTIAKGRNELLSGDIDTNRVRKVGGGNKKLKKNSRNN